MKKRLLIGLLILFGLNNITTAQEYVEGEVLVKFRTRSSVQMRAPMRQAFRSSQNNAMDSLFIELGVDSVEQLMPRTGHTNVGKKLRAYNGSIVEVKDLSKLYRLTLRQEKAHTVRQAIERLQQMDEVEFAEPNYIVYAQALPYDTIIPTQDSATYVSEPLYSQQWGLPAINLPQLWNKPKVTSKRPVIAILDTGVDIEHPDLAANIWTNPREANGASGQDDDNNGYVDDIHGWDCVNQSGVIADYNGHGTHCTGIAAAVGNNGIGITGANPDALIMPVTVLGYDGKGDIATIIRGIDYAAANGADVISMSLGHYSYSLAEEQALLRAYSSSVLVAAAGNDNKCIYKHKCRINGGCDNGPLFPAAFSFVLGVEASQNVGERMASFSNFDEDGPVYTEYEEAKLYNYELRAPGVDILSTFPGGRYKKLSGTSMACPMVAGAVSRLLQCKETPTKELLFGDLIHTRKNYLADSIYIGNVDVLASYNVTNSNRHPELFLLTYGIEDSTGDGDNRIDAGETIAISPVFKNSWGTATNIRYWFRQGVDVEGHWVYGDTSRITLLQDTAYFGKPLSSYAHAKAANSFRMSISPDCPDGASAYLTLFAICDNAPDTMKKVIQLTIENGVELGGIITDTLTLYPDVHYKIISNLVISENALVIIKPGTTLKFNDGVQLTNVGRIYAVGTPDSMITFTKTDTGTGWGGLYLNADDTLGYCVIEYINSEQLLIQGRPKEGGACECDDFIGHTFAQTALVHNSQIYNNEVNHSYEAFFGVQMACCNIFYNNFQNSTTPLFDNIFRGSDNWMNFNPCTIDKKERYFQKNNVIKNIAYFTPNLMNYYDWHTLSIYRYLYGNWFANDLDYYVSNINFGTNTLEVWDVPISEDFYIGSAREDIVRTHIYDIEYPNLNTTGRVNLDNMATRPIQETHGIVWKVVVNGYDAQDEFDSITPLGVGTHRCDVYFNRPMDVSAAPTITYGVRAPYEQHTVAENGAWSEDSTYYTAYFTIDSKTVSDGLNTFKITGARDPEHFEIPTEDTRFHVDISAAGSMSTGLMATPGLGKVTLTWETEEEDFEDLLGYNIYRWTGDTIRWNGQWEWDYEQNMSIWTPAGWCFDTICINTQLIDSRDSVYIDADIIPGKAYYYIIRQMTTSLSSSDISNPVTATPLTSIKGDANGSMSVNVADVMTEIAYIMEENPTPFIFEAADINNDSVINVIDIVGTVQIILNPLVNSNSLADTAAYYYVQNGILYLETDVVLGGVQLTLRTDEGPRITPLDVLNGFEKVSSPLSDTERIFLAYSMSGKVLGIGTHALLQIGDAEIAEIVLSDAQGHKVIAMPQASTALDGTLFLPNTRKYIDNGHMYIQIGTRTYSASGMLIRTK